MKKPDEWAFLREKSFDEWRELFNKFNDNISFLEWLKELHRELDKFQGEQFKERFFGEWEER